MIQQPEIDSLWTIPSFRMKRHQGNPSSVTYSAIAVPFGKMVCYREKNSYITDIYLKSGRREIKGLC
jgi:hypothetical protein